MFDIEYLITSDISKLLSDADNTAEQAAILLNLIEFETYYERFAGSISRQWYNSCGERYDVGNYCITDEDKEFVTQYAESVESIEKVKVLINKLCSISDGVYIYDEIISEAEKEMCIIQSIDVLDALENPKAVKKPSLKSLLSFNTNNN